MPGRVTQTEPEKKGINGARPRSCRELQLDGYLREKKLPRPSRKHLNLAAEVSHASNLELSKARREKEKRSRMGRSSMVGGSVLKRTFNLSSLDTVHLEEKKKQRRLSRRLAIGKIKQKQKHSKKKRSPFHLCENKKQTEMRGKKKSGGGGRGGHCDRRDTITQEKICLSKSSYDQSTKGCRRGVMPKQPGTNKAITGS